MQTVVAIMKSKECQASAPGRISSEMQASPSIMFDSFVTASASDKESDPFRGVRGDGADDAGSSVNQNVIHLTLDGYFPSILCTE